MKKLFLLTLFTFILAYCNGQNNVTEYKSYKFKLIGEVDKQPIFRYLRKNINDIHIEKNGATPGCLYKAKISESNYLIFYKFKKILPEFGNVVFINDKYQVSSPFTKKLNYEFVLFTKTDTFSIDTKLTGGFSSQFTFYNIQDILFISGFSQDQHIRSIVLNENPINMHILPVLGLNTKVFGHYLYFDYHHISKSRATPSPVDLYRVKIGDWNNPELLAEFISDSWLPLNDSIVLMTLPVKGRGKQVYYNVNNKTYVETETKLPTTYIKYEGKDYLLGVKRDEYGINKYALQPYPDIPEYGYKKDNQREILPRVLDVNLPNKDKQFSGTFITDELLYNATKEELKKLSSEKLRILRNAFFARQGYDFNSDDLKKFFGQFEWYNQLLESNEFFEISNEDVVISPKDKERVELILEIESSK